MKKYLFAIILIIAVILSVVVTFEYVSNANQTSNQTYPSIPTKIYSANGISFNYSTDWEEGNKTGQYLIAYIKDPQLNSSDGKPGAVVEVMKRTSNGVPLKRFYDDVKGEASNVPGYGVMSETTTTVDNVTAYEFTARAMDSNVEEQFNIVLFEKKGFIYMIACGTRAPTYLSDEEENFDIILNSFKVQ
ncbi:PsbP-related protein [Methanobacterium sp.]|uniref:PsbP-related protein n=1 Tax=Methanobacterium sp. TaxID=2164 RepID=UPI003C78A80D